jgi:hypothetical protein
MNSEIIDQNPSIYIGINGFGLDVVQKLAFCQFMKETSILSHLSSHSLLSMGFPPHFPIGNLMFLAASEL